MSDDASARLALPLLRAGQAQKEMTHNEALTLLDLAALPVVQAISDTPPASPDAGACWIVGSAPAGAWSGHAGAIAGWTDGGWRFIAPREGMALWCGTDAAERRYRSGVWVIGDAVAARLVVAGQQVVGDRRPAIGDPAGGTVVDAEARLAIGAILSALRTHGLIAS